MVSTFENEPAVWKKLIELGVFDEFYPQRLNACFRYLDVEKTQSFTLKVSAHFDTQFDAP
jgi:hypothetical protein